MISVNFNLRDNSANKETPINCKIRYSANVLTLPTKIKIHPSRWSKSKQKIKGTSQLVVANNATLKKLKDIAELEYKNFINDNQYEPDPHQLKNTILASVFGENNEEGETIPRELFKYIEYFAKVQERTTNPRTKRRISKRTIQDYHILSARLREFETDTRTTVSFQSIDLAFYLNFKEYLENRNYQVNTIGKYIKNLKCILNDATANGINKNLKFKGKGFFKPHEDTTEIYVNEDQLQELENLDLSLSPRLAKTRDLFLILCYTGQRYQSLKDVLNPKNRKGDKIILTQEKGNKKVVIPILPPLQQIFDRHQRIRPISNGKLNEYIKEICKKIPSFHESVDVEYTKGGKKICIEKPMYKLVRTHSGRRSFATNFYDRGYPIAIIMSVTGHKKEKTFFEYIRKTPEEHADKFSELYRKDYLRQIKAI